MPRFNFLYKAHYLPLSILLLYPLILTLLSIPAVQREFVYLNRIPIPLWPRYDNPEAYGLAPYKTRNLELITSDGERIGAWHVLPRSVYHASSQSIPPPAPLNKTVFEDAFTERPTIIYFHGNAGNRAARHRIRGYSAFSTYLDCNVLAIDYRGFADSTGTPSQSGLLTDAKTAWDYVSTHLHTRGVTHPEEQILLVGQSLGTGVVAGLAGMLAEKGVYPRALILIAPFSSISELLLTFKLFRFIPLLSPLRYFHGAQTYFQSFLAHPFNSTLALSASTSPTLLLHAVDDTTIPHHHSAKLFHSLRHGESVNETDYPGWGVIRSFHRDRKGEVIWWEGLTGGHNNLGWAEGTLDLIARVGHL